MAYLNSNIPVITCFIRDEYLFNHKKGFKQFSVCDIHSVASIEHRVPLFECLLENGVNWTRRPISAFCWKKDAPIYPLHYYVYWDCFSSYIAVNCRERLLRKSAELIMPNNKKQWGMYLFTLDWSHENRAQITDTNSSENSEHKCGHVFKMEDGNFFCYPNNRIIWYDPAFTGIRLEKNPGYLVDLNDYSVENIQKGSSDLHYMTEFTETGDTYDKAL